VCSSDLIIMADNMSDEEEKVTNLSNPEIVDKYKAAAAITNSAIAYVAPLCQPGASIVDICKAGDAFIEAEVAKIFSKSKVPKGISFPTCISVNNVVGHYSPLESDPVVHLQEGDVVKIDLGAQVDGLASQIGHTLVATANPANPITGRKADVICAAHFAGEIALRLTRPGNTSNQVIDAVNKVAQVFSCQPVLGVSSHKVDRFEVVSEKAVPLRVAEGEVHKPFTFEENETYIIDIVMSTGEGKPRELDTRTSVYRKTAQVYQLKIKASRYVLNEISTRFNTMPFTLRALDEKRGRLGIVECLKHNVVESYPVLYEKDGEFVAQFKFTVLLLPNSIQKLNTFNLPYVQSSCNITDPELQAILNLPLTRKSNAKKKRRKKAPKAPADAAAPADGPAPMDVA